MYDLHEIYIVKTEDYNNYKIVNEILIDKDNLSKAIVSVNDKILLFGVDYTINENELIFSEPLCIYDKIIIKDSILNNVKLITKNSYSKNALFKYYSSNVKFKFNQVYEFVISLNNKDYTNKFNSKHNPFYTTIENIRIDTGDLLANVSDNQIANVIYMNSKEALEKIEENEIDISQKIPTYVKNYVRYKTDIDFCYAIYLSISGKYGSYSKKIGDIQIDNTFKLPYLQEMIGRFKELLKPNEELLSSNAGAGTVASFVKAQSSDYPVSNRGVF